MWANEIGTDYATIKNKEQIVKYMLSQPYLLMCFLALLPVV